MRTAKDRLQKAVAETYGDGVRLLISLEEPQTETPVQQRERLELERRRDAVESFEKDPNVREMIDAFDARVERKSIQPR